MFRFKSTKLPEVIVIEPLIYNDHRGYFMKLYNNKAFQNITGVDSFPETNLSFSYKGVLRGLHYQKYPKAQGKLILVICGEIFDVAVDIRKGSPNYGKWVSIVLSEKAKKMVYIPPGFAHGFCVISENATILYKITVEYSPEYDRGIIWNDPELNIPWPVSNPILSEKDKNQPTLENADNNFIYKVNC